MSGSPVDLATVARDVLDSLLEGCQVIGFDWTYVYVNDAVASQAGRARDDLIGRTMMECFPGIEATPMFAELRRCMADRAHHRMENEFTFPDGRIGVFELRFVPVPQGVCILSIDQTERRRAQDMLLRTESQLRHAQKMEAIGRLASSVAHDFNNSLAVVLSCATQVLDALEPDDPLQHDLLEIEKAATHSRDLTTQLLAISRQQPVRPQVIDLSAAVRNMEGMLQRVLDADVELRLVSRSADVYITADPGHIEQIVLNLAINARDAMPLGGKLTVEIDRVELDADYAREHFGTQRGPHVVLAVSDTGSGMDAETQARIFEPFFTTKPEGKGTGLGLSTVFAIVQQSGGSIWVYSEVGKGTTFKLYFPTTDHRPAQHIAPDAKPALRPGVGTILIVDDHPQLLRLAANILRKRGYVVLTAANPAEAITLNQQHAEQIDVLLTDITMPGMSGLQLAEALRTTRPQMRVLFMSGYGGDAVQHQGVLQTDAAFVAKPFTPDSLSEAVQDVLASAPNA